MPNIIFVKPKIHLNNPRKIDTYSQWKAATSKYHRYSNTRRKHFTPQDKTTISKVFDGYFDKKKQKHVAGLRNHIIAVNEGRAVFVPLSKNKLRSIKTTKQFVATNKGFFVYGANIKKVTVKGKGKNISVQISKPQRREIYFSVKPKFKNIIDLVNWIWAVIKPNRVRVAYAGYSASLARSKRIWQTYGEQLATAEENIINSGYDTPFIGAYAIFDL